MLLAEAVSESWDASQRDLRFSRKGASSPTRLQTTSLRALALVMAGGKSGKWREHPLRHNNPSGAGSPCCSWAPGLLCAGERRGGEDGDRHPPVSFHSALCLLLQRGPGLGEPERGSTVLCRLASCSNVGRSSSRPLLSFLIVNGK